MAKNLVLYFGLCTPICSLACLSSVPCSLVTGFRGERIPTNEYFGTGFVELGCWAFSKLSKGSSWNWVICAACGSFRVVFL